MTTIFELLKQDHDDARTILLDALAAAESSGARDLVLELATMLQAHSRAEETVFYAGLKSTSEEGKDDANEGTVEHHVVDMMLAEIKNTIGRDKDMDRARLQVLMELLEHHIDEEENEMFELARDQLDDQTLSTMAERFQSEKRRQLDSLKAAE